MTYFASNTYLYTVEHMEYELNFECEEKVEDGMVWIKYGEHWYPEREATLDFPFADLNDDEFLDLYTPSELEKLERKDPLKKFSEKIAVQKTIIGKEVRETSPLRSPSRESPGRQSPNKRVI